MKLAEIANQLNSDIKKNNRFILFPHVMADGDAVGCCIALAKYLQVIKKDVIILMEEKIPSVYMFMNEGIDIQIYDESKKYEYEVCIALDTGDINRLGKRQGIYLSSITYNIDHHKTNNEYGLYNYIDCDASSVGEILFYLMKQMGVRIDHDMAQGIYVAISTDTGGFRYQNTNKKCFEISAELMDTGIDIQKISEWVFEKTNLKKLRLYESTIQNIKIYFNGKVALSSIRYDEYKSLDVTDEDFEGLVNIVKNIDGVDVGVFVRDRDNGEVKVNLRSNVDMVDVSLIACENNGGGHTRAAGFVSTKSTGEVCKLIMKSLEKYYQ
ncbi:MAG: bifunctional oligoribonuclease/PAP phosphatase NrnA [Clostridia bacterium]